MEFDVSGQRYSSGKISVFDQFSVIKRLAPLIGAIGPVMSADTLRLAQKRAAGVESGEGEKDDFAAQMGVVLPAIIDGMRAVSDDDARFIFTTCLKVVKRRSGQAMQSVWNAAAGDFQFQDISLPDMLMIVFNVLTDNLSSFLAGLPEPTEASPPAAPSSSP